MLVFKAILYCDGPDNFGMPNCTTRVEVEASISENFEIDRVPQAHDVVTFTVPSDWEIRHGRRLCPKCVAKSPRVSRR